MAKDIRVILIKLADRLHNMRTLQIHDTGEAEGKSQRDDGHLCSNRPADLVFPRSRSELDDLSLKYLEPDVYYDSGRIRSQHARSVRDEYIQTIVG